MSTKKEQEELYNTFKALDKNGDGRISKDELIIGYRRIYKELDDD
jgi:calcium-dependent protein kinase